MDEVWGWFCDLAATRGGGGMGGLSAITYAEIDAYCRLCDVTMDPHEVRAIVAVDRAFLSAPVAAGSEGAE